MTGLHPVFSWPGFDPDKFEHELLAGFLSMDLQGHPDAIRQFSDELCALQTGRVTAIERLGNMFDLRADADGVRITDAYDESKSGRVSVSDLAAALKAWRVFHGL